MINEGMAPDLDDETLNDGGVDADQTSDDYEYDDEDDDFDEEEEHDDSSDTTGSDKDGEIAELKNTVSSLMSQVQQLTQGQGNNQGNQSKSYTEAELRELYKKDPVAALSYITDMKSKAHAAQFAAQSEKQRYDDQANSTYPVSDPNFKKALTAEWNDLIQSGANPHGPKTYLKACQLAAKSLGITKKDKAPKARRKTRDSAPEGRPRSRSGGDSRSVSLPKTYKNQLDLFAVKYGPESDKYKSFEKKLVNQYKESRKRRR